MSELNRYRDEITAIDEKMAALFEDRMAIAGRIAKYKQEKGLSVRDKPREQAMIDRNSSFIERDDIRPYYVNFLQRQIDISCAFQEAKMQGMKVAYGGAEGAFAYIAAKTMFPEARLISNHDFKDAYRSVEAGRCDIAVLPLENSMAGEVGTVMDLMYSGSLFINQLHSLPIRHQLLGVPGAKKSDIKTVISHPQALSQCGKYIAKKGLAAKSATNTSAAARRVIENGDKTTAAIASAETAALFGLEILDEDIQDSNSNTTRFAAFSRSRNTPLRREKKSGENFILVFTVKNEAGALASTLNIIGAHGFNMRSLKSRPMRDLQWNYYFYIEAEGDINNQNGRDMLQELSALCAGLKLVGTYN